MGKEADFGDNSVGALASDSLDEAGYCEHNSTKSIMISVDCICDAVHHFLLR